MSTLSQSHQCFIIFPPLLSKRRLIITLFISLLVFLISVIYFEGELGCHVVGGGVSLAVLVSVILCKSTLFMFLTIVLISADESISIYKYIRRED
jgi:hypothetical protein